LTINPDIRARRTKRRREEGKKKKGKRKCKLIPWRLPEDENHNQLQELTGRFYPSVLRSQI
jgi:hypothetical protein